MKVVVSVLANGLLAAETLERMVCVANSVRKVSGSLSETVQQIGVGRATDCWPLRSVSVGTEQSLAFSRIAARCTQCSVQCTAKRTAYATIYHLSRKP